MLSERTWHERQLLGDLEAEISAGAVALIEDAVPLYEKLLEVFPHRAARIDWGRVPGAVHLDGPPERATSNFQLREPATELREFWGRVRLTYNIGNETEVIVLGDGLVSFALRLRVKILTDHLVDILSIPQHTYVVPVDFSWCFHYTVEDEAYWGVAPTDFQR